MKIDKSLQEVWGWKDALYEETKHMTMKERVSYLNKKGEEIEKKYKLRLKKISPKNTRSNES